MNDLKVHPVQGRVAPGFERVREAFAAGFHRADDYREAGAALAVYRAGVCVVDVWAGTADAEGRRPWQRDTRVNVYSTSKGIVATLAAALVERGRLAYDDLVVKHWPEYGAGGKDRTTVAQLLRHQSGLPGFAEPTAVEDLYDWRRACDRLARQTPMWPPGEKTSYHAMTWGFLVGEVLRRAGGAPLNTLLAQHVTGPLAAEFTLGLPPALEGLRAQMLPPRTVPDLSAVPFPPEAIAALVNPQLEGGVCNTPGWRAAEIPAANGHASAQGVARVYAALANGGALDGVRVLRAESVARMAAPFADRADLLLGFTDNWGLGVTLNQMNMLGPSPATFGHGGWGGSIGCANVEAQVGIGYVCNQMGAQMVGDPRAAGLSHVIWDCL